MEARWNVYSPQYFLGMIVMTRTKERLQLGSDGEYWAAILTASSLIQSFLLFSEDGSMKSNQKRGFNTLFSPLVISPTFLLKSLVRGFTITLSPRHLR